MNIAPTKEQIATALTMIQRDIERAAWLYAEAQNRAKLAEAALFAVRCLSQNPAIVTTGNLREVGFALGRNLE